MTATSTASDLGVVASSVINNFIQTGIDFLSTNALISALVIGVIAMAIIYKLMGWGGMR